MCYVRVLYFYCLQNVVFGYFEHCQSFFEIYFSLLVFESTSQPGTVIQASHGYGSLDFVISISKGNKHVLLFLLLLNAQSPATEAVPWLRLDFGVC